MCVRVCVVSDGWTRALQTRVVLLMSLRHKYSQVSCFTSVHPVVSVRARQPWLSWVAHHVWLVWSGLTPCWCCRWTRGGGFCCASRRGSRDAGVGANSSTPASLLSPFPVGRGSWRLASPPVPVRDAALVRGASGREGGTLGRLPAARHAVSRSPAPRAAGTVPVFALW